jgi:hypothetical protein
MWIYGSFVRPHPYFLRFLIEVIIVFCSYYAVKICNIGFDKNWNSSDSLKFIVFGIIPVEDLNYLHNVGYMFTFPILGAIFNLANYRKNLLWPTLAVCIFSIDKPIVACLILATSALMNLREKRKELRLWKALISLYCLIYLFLYFYLPSLWKTPFTREISVLFKIVVNLTYLPAVVLLPIVYIGLLDFLKFIKLNNLSYYIGVPLYFVPWSALIFKYKKIKLKAHLDNITKVLLAVTVLQYVMVYALANSYWIKNFPLTLIPVPQHIFMRWSAALPYLVIILVNRMMKLKATKDRKKFETLFYLVLFSQYLLIYAFAYPFLRRYW